MLIYLIQFSKILGCRLLTCCSDWYPRNANPDAREIVLGRTVVAAITPTVFNPVRVLETCNQKRKENAFMICSNFFNCVFLTNLLADPPSVSGPGGKVLAVV